jgi:hypothetical protein
MSELSRLSAGASSLGAFCAVVIGDRGLDVLVQGGVPLNAIGAATTEKLSNGQTHLHDVTSLDLLIGDAKIDTLLSLDEGVIAADGFSLRARAVAELPWSSPAAPAGVDRAPVKTAGQSSANALSNAPGRTDPVKSSGLPASMISLHEMTDDDLPAAAPLPIATPSPIATPAPVATPAPAAVLHADAFAPTTATPIAAAAPPLGAGTGPAAGLGPQPVRVKGLVCARGHFNDPRTRFCATCGIAMHQTSFILTEDIRPPLGVLVMSDGAYHTLVTSLVFGRDPDDDPEVREGRAQGVTLIDPGNTISRIHAEIRAVDWDVNIVDHGSTNGTFVWSAERQQWDRLTPNEAIPLAPGSHVAFGRLTATYESSNRQKG